MFNLAGHFRKVWFVKFALGSRSYIAAEQLKVHLFGVVQLSDHAEVQQEYFSQFPGTGNWHKKVRFCTLHPSISYSPIFFLRNVLQQVEKKLLISHYFDSFKAIGVRVESTHRLSWKQTITARGQHFCVTCQQVIPETAEVRKFIGSVHWSYKIELFFQSSYCSERGGARYDGIFRGL